MRLPLGLLVLAACHGIRTAPADRGPDQAHAAAARGVRLLQASQEIWIKKRECLSCHHQGIGIQAIAVARRAGIPVDEALFARQVERARTSAADDIDDFLVGNAYINGQFGSSYLMVAGWAAGIRDFAGRDFMIHYVAGKQARDGRWPSDSHRAPIEDSPVTVTALAMRSLSVFGFPGRPDLARRVARARAWLAAFDAVTVEDRSYQILGLAWTGSRPEELARLREGLVALQHEDGGWAQLATREPDAYATGEALVALVVGAGLSPASPVFRRGITWLLRHQLADGSWHVATRRRVEGLRYFETGFPHGVDQYVSAGATAWALMALSLAVAPSAGELLVASSAPTPLPPPANLVETALRGSDDELRRLLESTRPDDPALGRALFAALHDEARVRLLLDRGAPVDFKLGKEATPLWTAGGYSGAGKSVGLLLARGANPKVTVDGMSAVLWASGPGGDLEGLRALIGAGVDPSVGDAIGPPIAYAVLVEDAEKVGLLVDAGVDLRGPGAAAPLLAGALDGREAMVDYLLSRGAAVDVTDPSGRTALHYAAMTDWGHTRILAALLRKGAKPDVRDKANLTPLDYAAFFGHAAHRRLLEACSRELGLAPKAPCAAAGQP